MTEALSESECSSGKSTCLTDDPEVGRVAVWLYHQCSRPELFWVVSMRANAVVCSRSAVIDPLQLSGGRVASSGLFA